MPPTAEYVKSHFFCRERKRSMVAAEGFRKENIMTLRQLPQGRA
jgi:hypothetical protein